jgi:hypothetical protein
LTSVPPLALALNALAEGLEGMPAMLIGGMAIIQRGIPRLTTDVDATISGWDLDLPSVLVRLAAADIHPRIEAPLEFARKHQILLLRHTLSGTPIDLSLAWLPFEQEALGRATRESFLGATFAVAQPEDLLIYKAFAWRPQDQQDAERLILLHGHTMDLGRIRRILAELLEATDESGRLADFDALVKRSRP